MLPLEIYSKVLLHPMDKNDMFRTKEGLVAAHYLFYVELNKIYRISAADKAYISVPQEPSEAGNPWTP